MFGFGDNDHNQLADANDQVYNDKHEGSFTHELISGAAAFEAVKAWEDHQRANGQEVKWGFAKEMLAGFAGAEVDKLVETKGLDYLDAEKAKRQAREQAEQLAQYKFGGDE